MFGPADCQADGRLAETPDVQISQQGNPMKKIVIAAADPIDRAGEILQGARDVSRDGECRPLQTKVHAEIRDPEGPGGCATQSCNQGNDRQ